MPITPFNVDLHRFTQNVFFNINEVKRVLKVNKVPENVIREYIKSVRDNVILNFQKVNGLESEKVIWLGYNFHFVQPWFLEITEDYVSFAGPGFKEK